MQPGRGRMAAAAVGFHPAAVGEAVVDPLPAQGKDCGMAEPGDPLGQETREPFLGQVARFAALLMMGAGFPGGEGLFHGVTASAGGWGVACIVGAQKEEPQAQDESGGQGAEGFPGEGLHLP